MIIISNLEFLMSKRVEELISTKFGMDLDGGNIVLNFFFPFFLKLFFSFEMIKWRKYEINWMERRKENLGLKLLLFLLRPANIYIVSFLFFFL